MADGNTQPGNKTGKTGCRNNVFVCTLIDTFQQENSQYYNCCCQQCQYRYTATVYFSKSAVSHAVFTHCIQHTGRCIKTGIAGRKNGSQNHSVHYGCGKSQTGTLKYQCKGRFCNLIHICTKQSIAVIRNKQTNYQHGQNIKNQNAPENLFDCFGNTFLRVF